jgi:hypothetical protein
VLLSQAWAPETKLGATTTPKVATARNTAKANTSFRMESSLVLSLLRLRDSACTFGAITNGRRYVRAANRNSPETIQPGARWCNFLQLSRLFFGSVSTEGDSTGGNAGDFDANSASSRSFSDTFHKSQFYDDGQGFRPVLS